MRFRSWTSLILVLALTGAAIAALPGQTIGKEPPNSTVPVARAPVVESNKDFLPLAHEVVQFIGDLIPLIVFLFLGPGIGIFILVTLREVRQPVVLIEPFEMPPDLVERGLTGRACVAAIKVRIDLIRFGHPSGRICLGQEEDRDGIDFRMESSGEMFVIEMPVAGFTSRDFILLLRKVFRRELLFVQGHWLHGAGGDFLLLDVIWKSGRRVYELNGQDLLMVAAETLTHRLDPGAAANYYADRGRVLDMRSLAMDLRFGHPGAKDLLTALVIEGYALVEEALAAKARDKWVELEAIARRVIALEVANAAGYYFLGTAAISLGRNIKTATENFERAIQLNPKLFRAHNNLGLCFYLAGEFDRAIEKYALVIQHDPGNAIAWNNWGHALFARGELNLAIEKYNRALDSNPAYAMAWYNLGNALAKQGDYSTAIEKYERAIALNPGYSEALNKWGVALARLGNFEEAIEKFSRADRLKPDSAVTFNNWGNTLAKMGNHDEAIAMYTKAGELRPDYAKVQNNWGNTLFEKKDFPGAIAKYEQALALLTVDDPMYATIKENLNLARQQISFPTA